MIQKMIKICMSFLLLIGFSMEIKGEENPKQGVPDLAKHAQSAYLMEYTSGKVLYAKNENEKLYPASMTKMMGLLLIFEDINSGKLKWDDQVVTSSFAAGMGGSQVYLEENETLSVKDMVKSICIASANDAMSAMGEHIGGTNEHFVEMMNKKAKELGMKNTQFTNVTGLHDPKHYSCAKDMAVLGQALIKEGGQQLLDITSTYDAYIRENSEKPFWLVNTNKLLKSYPGVDGLKSGYTSEAKSCITITAKKNGLRLIAVVMKEPDSKVRNAEIQTMLDYGFLQYEQKVLYKKGSRIQQIKVENGKPDSMYLVTKEDVISVYEKGKPTKVKEKKIVLNKKNAPYKKGEEVGIMHILMNDGYQMDVKLYADKNIEALDYIDIFMKGFHEIFA